MTASQIDDAIAALERGLNRTRAGVRLGYLGLLLIAIGGGFLAKESINTRTRANQTRVVVSRSPCTNLTARECAIKLERARQEPAPKPGRAVTSRLSPRPKGPGKTSGPARTTPDPSPPAAPGLPKPTASPPVTTTQNQPQQSLVETVDQTLTGTCQLLLQPNC